MLLALSERATLWFHGDIHFSFADRGPKDIDVDSLDDEAKILLQNAINFGILLKSKLDDATVDSAKVDEPDKKSVVENRVDSLISRAKTQLKGSAKTIVSWCKKQGIQAGPQMLEAMLKIEKSKQKRKGVVGAIEKALKKTGGVSTVLDDEDDSETIEIKVG